MQWVSVLWRVRLIGLAKKAWQGARWRNLQGDDQGTQRQFPSLPPSFHLPSILHLSPFFPFFPFSILSSAVNATKHLSDGICHDSNNTQVLFSFRWGPASLLSREDLLRQLLYREEKSSLTWSPLLNWQTEEEEVVGECVFSSSSHLKYQHFTAGVSGDWADWAARCSGGRRRSSVHTRVCSELCALKVWPSQQGCAFCDAGGVCVCLHRNTQGYSGMLWKTWWEMFRSHWNTTLHLIYIYIYIIHYIYCVL